MLLLERATPFNDGLPFLVKFLDVNGLLVHYFKQDESAKVVVSETHL